MNEDEGMGSIKISNGSDRSRHPKPVLEARQSKAGGYLVIAAWPGGQQQQMDGFADEAAARQWIDNESEVWISKNPFSHRGG